MSEAINPQFDPTCFTPEAIGARLAEDRRLRRLNRRPGNTLHVRPNLAYYQEQARSIQRSRRENDPKFKLHAAQLELARGLGFVSWPKLVAAIHARERATNELQDALFNRDQDAVARIVRAHPLSVFDAGCIASPDELGLLLEFVLGFEHDSDRRIDLLDAVAEHHAPEGLEECVRMLLNGRVAVPLYANDIILDRRERAAASQNGARAVELFDNVLSVLVWYVDEPDFDYMPEDD